MEEEYLQLLFLPFPFHSLILHHTASNRHKPLTFKGNKLTYSIKQNFLHYIFNYCKRGLSPNDWTSQPLFSYTAWLVEQETITKRALGEIILKCQGFFNMQPSSIAQFDHFISLVPHPLLTSSCTFSLSPANSVLSLLLHPHIDQVPESWHSTL